MKCEVSSTRCISCDPGYIVLSDFTCGCINNCETCDSNGCLTCKPGFSLSGNNCNALGFTDCDMTSVEWKKIVINNPLRKY